MCVLCVSAAPKFYIVHQKQKSKSSKINLMLFRGGQRGLEGFGGSAACLALPWCSSASWVWRLRLRQLGNPTQPGSCRHNVRRTFLS